MSSTGGLDQLRTGFYSFTAVHLLEGSILARYKMHVTKVDHMFERWYACGEDSCPMPERPRQLSIADLLRDAGNEILEHLEDTRFLSRAEVAIGVSYEGNSASTPDITSMN